jgi:hypothetical protein
MKVAFQLENPLDAQHLLNLVLHRHAVFEVQRCVGAQCETPVAFVFENPTAKFVANTCVLLEAVKIVPRQFLHVRHNP